MTLRFAYNTNGAANHRLDDALHMIADAGYDGVALTLDQHHLDPFADDWAREAERVGTLLRSLGLGSVIETGARYLLDPRDKHEPTLVTADSAGRDRRTAPPSRFSGACCPFDCRCWFMPGPLRTDAARRPADTDNPVPASQFIVHRNNCNRHRRRTDDRGYFTGRLPGLRPRPIFLASSRRVAA